MAAATGTSLRAIRDLDDDEVEALADAVAERERNRSWSQTDEMLASCLEVLSWIAGQLGRGVPVVQIAKQASAPTAVKVPRPPWVGVADDPAAPDPTRPASTGEIVLRPRELFQQLTGGR